MVLEIFTSRKPHHEKDQLFNLRLSETKNSNQTKKETCKESPAKGEMRDPAIVKNILDQMSHDPMQV